MVSRGPWKPVPREESEGRLINARAFLRAAEVLLESAEKGGSGNPIMTQAVDATIAYADAVCIKFGGIRNSMDHHAVARTMQQAIGARFTAAQRQRLGQILGEKDEAAYGAHVATVAEARELVKQARRFAGWAEAELARPG